MISSPQPRLLIDKNVGTVDTSTGILAVGGSPTDITMMHVVTEEAAKSYSYSDRAKNILRKFSPFTMGTGTVDEVDTQEQTRWRLH